MSRRSGSNRNEEARRIGELEVESGEWRVESGEWRVGSGELGVESGELVFLVNNIRKNGKEYITNQK